MNYIFWLPSKNYLAAHFFRNLSDHKVLFERESKPEQNINVNSLHMEIGQHSMSLRVKINPKVEERFREAAMKRFGCGKDALSVAAEEAILKWLSTTEKEPSNFEGDPVKAIEGLLKDVNVDSVTLQHNTQKLWAKKVLTHCRSKVASKKI